MKVSRLQPQGAMRMRMLSVKAAPSIKLGTSVKTTTGPNLKSAKPMTGSPVTRGEMI